MNRMMARSATLIPARASGRRKPSNSCPQARSGIQAKILPEQRIAVPQERREEVVRRELVDGGRRRDLWGPIGPTLRPREALDVEPGRSGEDVGVAAPGTLGSGAPEPVQQAELDEAG